MVGCEGLSTVLGLTQVLSDTSLAPAERLALFDSLLGLRVAQPSTSTHQPSFKPLQHTPACDDSQWVAPGHDQQQLAAAQPASAGQLQQSAAKQARNQPQPPLQQPGAVSLGDEPVQTLLWDSSSHQLLHQGDSNGSAACAQRSQHQGPFLRPDQQQHNQDLYKRRLEHYDADIRQPFSSEQLAHRQLYMMFQQQQAAEFGQGAAAQLIAATDAPSPPASSETQLAATQHQAACHAPQAAVYMAAGTARPLQASEQHQASQQQHRKPSTDDEEWLPPDEGLLRYNSRRNNRTDVVRTSPGSPAQQQQDQIQQEPHDQEQERADDDDCRKQSNEGRRTRKRKNRVVEMLQSVRLLTQQLEQLGENNASLRQHEQQLEDQLVDRERQVTSMLASKHESMSFAPPGSQPSSAALPQADAASYKLLEPCLGYHPSVFKQDYLPTVNGGIVSPGVLPMFSPLPESAVRAGAQNLTRFVQDALELRALHAGTAREQAVEEYLHIRVSTMQGVMRRYNVMNPVFAYQLRAINLSTCQPANPPAGHWAAMAQLMRTLITDKEYNNIKLAHRLFQASLRAVKKEQSWVLSQITTTSQRLQRMRTGHVLEQQLSHSTSSSSSHVIISALESSGSTATSSVVSSSTASTPSSSASSAFDTPLPTEAALLEQMHLQQQLDDLLQHLEVLLLREHDQHFTLLWSCVKMPSSIKVVMELVLSSYPYFVNYHEILPHLLQEDSVQ